jgi:hypothetical protein
LRRNEKHYSQATYTAFGEAGPGFPYIDPDSPDSDKYIDDLLEGVFEPWETASPHVRELLAELKCTVEEELDTQLHLKDFISIFKFNPEGTASSVSGRHYGHYKVLGKLDDDTYTKTSAPAGFSKTTRRLLNIVLWIVFLLPTTSTNKKFHQC